MRNAQLYFVAFVLGILAIIVGLLYQAKVLGNHPTRVEAAFIVGIILLIVGVVGLVLTRNKRRL